MQSTTERPVVGSQTAPEADSEPMRTLREWLGRAGGSADDIRRLRKAHTDTEIARAIAAAIDTDPRHPCNMGRILGALREGWADSHAGYRADLDAKVRMLADVGISARPAQSIAARWPRGYIAANIAQVRRERAGKPAGPGLYRTLIERNEADYCPWRAAEAAQRRDKPVTASAPTRRDEKPDEDSSKARDLAIIDAAPDALVAEAREWLIPRVAGMLRSSLMTRKPRDAARLVGAREHIARYIEERTSATQKPY